MATPEQIAIQRTIDAATNDVARAMSTAMQQMVSKLSGVSTSQADTLDRNFTHFNKRVRESAADVADQLQDAADIIDTDKLRKNTEAERRLFEQRLSSQSHFFSREDQYRAAELKRLAEELQENKELGQRAIDLIKQQQVAEATERQEAIKARREIGKSALAGKVQIQTSQARLEKQKITLAEKTAAAIAAKNMADKTQLEAEAANARDLIKHEQNELDMLNAKFGEKIKAYDKHTTKIKECNESVSKLAGALTETEKKVGVTNEKLNETVTAFKKADIKQSISKFKQSFEEGIKDKLLNTALIGAGVKGLFDEVRTGINRGMGMLNKDEQVQTMQLGMSPKEMMEAAGEYRRSMIAAGGLGDSLNTLTSVNTDLMADVASSAERTKYGLQQMEMFTNMGIRPSTEAIKKQSARFKEMHRATGMTIDQFNTSMRDIMESEDMLQTMRMANSESEREAIADSVAARYKENRLRGVSDEQTRAILKLQQKQANEKPLTRYQKAIKSAAYAGAMGVEGGQELVRLAMKPETAWTDDERARHANIKDRMNRATNQGLSSDNFATQLRTSALATGLAQEEEEKTYNTSLAKAVEDGAGKGMNAATESFSKMTDDLVTGNQAFELAMGAAQNSWVKLLAGITGLALLLVPQIAAVVSNTLAVNANTVAHGGVGVDLPESKNKNTKTAKMLRRGGGAVAVGLGAYEAYNMYDSKKQNGGEAIGSGTGAAVGGIAGAALGGAAAGAIGGPPGMAIGAIIGIVGGGVLAWLGSGAGGKLGSMVDNIKNDDDPSNAQINARVAQEEARVNAYTSQATAKAMGKTMSTQLVPEWAGAQIKAPQASSPQGVVASAETADDAAKSKNSQDKIKARDDINMQLKKMDDANNYLKTVAENVPKLVDLASKQLIMSTMTEKERVDKRDKVKKDSGLSANSYNYFN